MSSSGKRTAVGVGTAVAAALLTGAVAAQSADGPRFGFGRTPTAEQIEAWDIDVRPDGHGLRPGKGTVAQGQQIYDAQCQSCHGIFGEQINFHQTPLVGGATAEDVKAGTVAEFRKANPLRTTTNKLNTATTLWDYINRAMPWTNPQSLTVDQVYAVTAYILNMANLVPDDFELTERNIRDVKMPNRNGFTTAHGMRRVSGTPDTKNVACMSNCAGAPKIASELPAYARNDHGNLAEQKRGFGPVRGIDTARYASVGAAQVVAAAPAAAPAEALPAREIITKLGCTACHGINNKIIGPGYTEIAAKYAKQADAEAYLIGKMKAGGQGAWGQIPMPAQALLTDADARTVAQWILAGAK
jgi:cytochrome c551/c552